jgi:dienelactone hydrolase
MSKASKPRVVKTRASYDPVALLDQMTDSSRPSFRAKSPAAARAWQREMRAKLADCLGFVDAPRVDPKPRVIESVDRGSYVREKIVLRTMPGAELPLYLLVPKKPKRGLQARVTNKDHGRDAHDTGTPAVLALHGHGYGAKDIVGLWEDGRERRKPHGYHKDFACALAEAGFVVAAPEISGFGERRHAYPNAHQWRLNATCHGASTYAIMLGKSIAGLRALDNMRVLDYLATRPEVDPDRIGAMGLSGGGTNTFFTTALDLRIKACVISGYFCDWRHSILDIFHCTCNFVPGVLNLGELSDLAALIAPRPCLIEHGTRDPIFPIEHVKKTVAKAKRAWKIFGMPENLQTDYFPGDHQIHGKEAYRFLRKHLTSDA